jgi:hypothetical protein
MAVWVRAGVGVRVGGGAVRLGLDVEDDRVFAMGRLWPEAAHPVRDKMIRMTVINTTTGLFILFPYSVYVANEAIHRLSSKMKFNCTCGRLQRKQVRYLDLFTPIPALYLLGRHFFGKSFRLFHRSHLDRSPLLEG